jgi:hypothetical protein
MSVPRLKLKLSQEDIADLSSDELSDGAATRLTRIALSVMNFEADQMQLNSDNPAQVRQWLAKTKRRIDRVIGRRFSIEATVVSVTRGKETELAFKFKKKNEDDQKR